MCEVMQNMPINKIRRLGQEGTVHVAPLLHQQERSEGFGVTKANRLLLELVGLRVLKTGPAVS